MVGFFVRYIIRLNICCLAVTPWEKKNEVIWSDIVPDFISWSQQQNAFSSCAVTQNRPEMLN